jgi:hypothetical protein
VMERSCTATSLPNAGTRGLSAVCATAYVVRIRKATTHAVTTGRRRSHLEPTFLVAYPCTIQRNARILRETVIDRFREDLVFSEQACGRSLHAVPKQQGTPPRETPFWVPNQRNRQPTLTSIFQNAVAGQLQVCRPSGNNCAGRLAVVPPLSGVAPCCTKS